MAEVDKIKPLQDGISSWSTNPFLHAKRVYLNFIQFLFRENNPTGLIYRDDPNTTDIVILEGGIVSPELVGKRPAIAVTRDAAALQAKTMGSAWWRSAKDDMIIREETIPFTIVTNIVSLHPQQVEDLGWYVMSRTWLHMDILSSEGFFDAGTNITATAPGPATSVFEGDIGGYYLVRLIMPVRAIVKFSISAVNYERLKELWITVRDKPTREKIVTIKAELDNFK